MSTTATQYVQRFFLLVAVLAAAALGGCKSLETRLQEAEIDGRLNEAFRLAVEYYDDNRNDPEVKAEVALERVGNAFLSYQIQMAERALSREEFTEALSLLYNDPANSAVSVIRTAEMRGVQLAKRNVPEAMRSGVMTALESYYSRGLDLFNRGDYHAALAHFKKMHGLKDADRYIRDAQMEVDYSDALAVFNNKKYRKAYELFGRLGSFRDAAQMKAESLKRGKITVAVFGFEGDRSDVVRARISKRLGDDIFIEVINGDNMARYVRAIPDIANNANIKYLVSGKAVFHCSSPDIEQLDPDVERAWVITGGYHEIQDSTGKVVGYIRKSVPLSFSKERLWYRGDMHVAVEIANASNGYPLFTDDLRADSHDEVIVWHFRGRYSPDRFTVHDPSGDTLNSTYAWRASSEDRCFQDNFTEARPLIEPDVMAEAMLSSLAKKSADKIQEAMYRLEVQ